MYRVRKEPLLRYKDVHIIQHRRTPDNLLKKTWLRNVQFYRCNNAEERDSFTNFLQ